MNTAGSHRCMCEGGFLEKWILCSGKQIIFFMIIVIYTFISYARWFNLPSVYFTRVFGDLDHRCCRGRSSTGHLCCCCEIVEKAVRIFAILSWLRIARVILSVTIVWLPTKSDDILYGVLTCLSVTDKRKCKNYKNTS